jgi:aspartate/glutamate racemase
MGARRNQVTASDPIQTTNDEERYPMDSAIDLAAINARIVTLKKTALELKALGADIPCLCCNTARILASLKMLEIGFSDVVELES